MSEACRLAGTVGGRSGCNGACSGALAIGLENRLGHLLDEQRDAISSLDDVLSDVCRNRSVADNAINSPASRDASRLMVRAVT